MITATPTEHLNGIMLEGEYDDFSELVDCIYRMTGLEDDYKDLYWSVKNRLLGMCYDIRHAYQGDRHVKLVDSGADEELMKWHSMILPRQNVHFAVEILFPEAVFVALSVPELYLMSYRYYGRTARSIKEKTSDPGFVPQTYADYVRDKALLDTLCSVILAALSKVIGDEELEKLIHQKEGQYLFGNYAAQYVDKCNIDYLKTPLEKKKDKLRNIAKRLVKKPDAYNRLKQDLEYSAKIYGCSMHELHDPKIEYPEEMEW